MATMPASSGVLDRDPNGNQEPPLKKDRTHWLYIMVIIAVVAGAAIGLLAPELGKALKPLGTGFVALIKMIIAPVIFCTIVLGIGSIAKAATVGKVGGLALVYFITMSTFALAIGLVVGNLIHPGAGLHLQPYQSAAGGAENATVKFLLELIPGDIPVLPTLVAGPLRRLRPAVDGQERRAGARRHQEHPGSGLPPDDDDHVG